MMKATRRALLQGLLTSAAVGALGCDEKKPEQPAAGSSSAASSAGGGPKKKYVIAWSIWTGWMPFKLMQEKGLLEKRAKEHGVEIELKEFKGYMDSVTAFAAKQVDGVTMTSMEALQPASKGVETVAILVNDTSNGGDGVLMRGADPKLDQLKGKTVLLEEFSVSHYLLVRALESVGLAEKDVKIKNTPGDDAGKAFLTDDSVEAVATWNPHLFKAVESGKGKVVFSSKQISGEIIDFLCVNGQALKESPGLGKALVAAWYDAMELITGSGKQDAIAAMASAAGASVDEFNKMLADTDLYTDRKRCAEFLGGETLKQTMEKVSKFSLDHGLIEKAVAIGYGGSASEKLRFDNSFVSG